MKKRNPHATALRHFKRKVVEDKRRKLRDRAERLEGGKVVDDRVVGW